MKTETDKINIFINNDKTYLKWIKENPKGFVVNSFLQPSPEYLRLHRASCGTISTPKRTNWTTTGYIKICSLEKTKLKKWAKREVRGQLWCCQCCKP